MARDVGQIWGIRDGFHSRRYHVTGINPDRTHVCITSSSALFEMRNIGVDLDHGVSDSETRTREGDVPAATVCVSKSPTLDERLIMAGWAESRGFREVLHATWSSELWSARSDSEDVGREGLLPRWRQMSSAGMMVMG